MRRLLAQAIDRSASPGAKILLITRPGRAKRVDTADVRVLKDPIAHHDSRR